MNVCEKSLVFAHTLVEVLGKKYQLPAKVNAHIFPVPQKCKEKPAHLVNAVSTEDIPDEHCW